MTRSRAASKCALVDVLLVVAAGDDGRLVRDVGEIGAGEPCGLAGDAGQIDVCGERLPARVHLEDRLAAGQIRRGHEDLAIEASRPQQCGVEVLEPVRSAHHDHLVAVAEAVELDEQLVQRLVLLAVEAATGARHADGVELVDEDDRGRVLPRLLEELADPRRAEAREHLDERRGALRVEVGARLVGDGLGEQRLARAGRPVEEDALRHAGAERCEALRVREEIDDLLHLGPCLLEAGDLVPVHERLRGRLHVGRLHPRHHLEGAPEQVDDEPEHDQRQPDQRHRADLGSSNGRCQASPAHRHRVKL